MKVIESNSDLPKCLNTVRKQSAKAKLLAQSYLKEPAAKASRASIQGCFSRTFVVTMESGEECVIQFRVEPINTDEFDDARGLLGDVVPKISKISDTDLEGVGVIPYYMTLIQGVPWLQAKDELDIVALNSLGTILSRGYVAADSSTVVDKIVLPKLQSFQHSADDRIKPFKPLINTLVANVTQLKRLPLFVSHADLNKMNILVHEDGTVSGIVDWEGVSKLPFGMGFCRIHVLAGKYIDGEFHMPETFEVAERGFWRAVFDNVTSTVRKTLEDNLEVVQMSVIVGMLLEDLDSEHGFNPVALKALPMLLKYRIPALRRLGEPPYGELES